MPRSIYTFAIRFPARIWVFASWPWKTSRTATRKCLFTNYAAIVQAVGEDPNGIGYSSLGVGKGGGVKAVSIGGVEPSFDSVNKHEYPYARTLHLYTNKNQEAPTTHDFIQFVESPHGQEILQQMGFVPHS